MTAGTTTAAAPLLKIARWPDANRAAVGLAGSAAAPITTLSSSSWAHSPRSIQGNRFERRFCYGDSEGESGFKRQYRTFVWLINDKGLRHAAERNLSTMSRVISSERHHWRPLASVIASELQSLSLRRSSEASRAGVSAPQIGHRRIFVDAGQRHSPTAGTECIQRRE